MIGARFGRNVPVEGTYPESAPQLLEPNPRVVSRELLTRDEFKPATIVNVLAGAWLQFEVHDWFSHGKNVPEEPFELDLADDDPWPDRPMRIERTRSDPAPDANGGPPTYVTADSHWWDGSQIYGSDPAFSEALRSKEDGKLRLDPDGQLPRDLEAVVDLTGVAGNFWLGLALLHTVFTHEHNSICDRLKADNPRWSDDELYAARAPDQRRPDGEDPHRRVDAGDHRPPDDQVRDARQLVRHPRQAPGQAQLERGPRRHPRLAHEPPRRSLLADRGVRRRLPDAPAAARRLHVPVDRDGRGAAGADVPGARSARHPRPAGRGRLRQLVLLARGRPPGRDHAAQLPALPAGVPAARRNRRRPRRDRRPAHPRAGRSALQRVPAALPPEAGGDVRGADRQPGVGEGAAARLRGRRAGRPDGRPLRRAAAEGVRLQRHRVPRLHPDGVAAAEERPLLHQRLQRGDLHAERVSTGSTRRR